MTAPKGRGRGAPANGKAEVGSVLADRYRLEERVAAGGMGEVWRATDLLLERTVAVKLLRETLAEDPVVSERFRREALLAAQLSHPNMAGVYDYVQNEGRPGIVMEFVDGETLAERLARQSRLSVAESVRVASHLLSALGSAHQAGIVHRDVKPGNVMLTEAGGVKVTDFGIARAASDHTLTETGMVIGTAHYLSPEQVSGNTATPGSDLYSVGAVMYEMLAGQKPFEAESPIAVAMKRLTEEPEPVRSLREDVPVPVAEVVTRALARDPAARFASAEEMRRALDTAAGASTPATVPHRIDPTPTDVLPVSAPGDAATTRAIRPQSEPGTGEAPAPVVAERRRREYRRAIVWIALIALAVALGSILFLALVGRGTDFVTVPTLTGKTFETAKSEAEARGLRVERRNRDSTRPVGTVIGQDIKAGARVVSGEKITLSVSTGNPPPPAAIPIPDVRDLDRDEAERQLRAVGFQVEVDTVETNEADPGVVIGTDPGPGEMAQPGQTVIIRVATEPKKGHGKDRGGD